MAGSLPLFSLSRRLNSTLSTRIEDLNAQVSTLYAENLRLRATEIALNSELKRERDKSRKIMEEAETAVRCNLEFEPAPAVTFPYRRHSA